MAKKGKKLTRRAKAQATEKALATTGNGYFDVTGVVAHTKNIGRGFVFVRPYAGEPISQDVFLHVSLLKEKRLSGDIEVGSIIRCMAEVKDGDKGPRAVEVVSVSPPKPVAGVVKFFNASKHFGFITAAEEGAKDIFVHESALERCGIDPALLKDGVDVVIRKLDRSNPKGPAALELALA